MKKFVFLLLFTTSLPTFAERWFDVEMIVFKHNVSPSKAGENWPESPAKVDMSQTLLYSNAAGLAKYKIDPLSNERFELTDYYDQLAESGKYQNLMHIGWQQNDAGRKSMPKIRLAGGKKVGDKSELDGYIRLYVDHYLFLETDLVFSQAASRAVKTSFNPHANAPTSTNYETYVQSVNVKDKRRMRSSEIHYLDHPLMGIIIQVRRINQD